MQKYRWLLEKRERVRLRTMVVKERSWRELSEEISRKDSNGGWREGREVASDEKWFGERFDVG